MMRLKSSVDFMAFLKTAKTCQGAVRLVTSNGDMLDLRSALCQMIAVITVKRLKGAESVEIQCEKAEDYQLLKDYLTEQPK